MEITTSKQTCGSLEVATIFRTRKRITQNQEFNMNITVYKWFEKNYKLKMSATV